MLASVLNLFLFTSLIWGAGLILSPELPKPGECEDHLAMPGVSGEITAKGGADKLFRETSRSWWELDDYGPVFRFSALKRSESDQFVIEEFNPSMDIGPSPAWIQYLQSMGLMPASLQGQRWSEIEHYMTGMGLIEAHHPLRGPHLQAQRLNYLDRIRDAFDLAMSEYQRRTWFTDEFKKGAIGTLYRTLRTASYVVVRSKSNGEVIAGIRFVRVHNARLSLKHVKSGRTLEILGNAEWLWGVNNQPRFSRESLFEIFQVGKHLPEFLRGSDSKMSRISELEPIEMVKLPMETDLKIDLPRNFLPLEVRGKKGFEDGNLIKINGETFFVELGHAALVEPGLFSIKKGPLRAQAFMELSIWQSKYFANPRLPGWVPARSVAPWTYNDLPLYTIYNFKEDEAFKPISKYGVKWKVYGATVDGIQSALQNLAGQRGDETQRAKDLKFFLKEMEKRGF